MGMIRTPRASGRRRGSAGLAPTASRMSDAEGALHEVGLLRIDGVEPIDADIQIGHVPSGLRQHRLQTTEILEGEMAQSEHGTRHGTYLSKHGGDGAGRRF